ncbi:E3 ubiquitin-protein ligase XERICO [Populus alba x Populus x berolinensis]|nr:E3 ubiquitin-protein ligase XERICO [Populus alba x Populus x berolinensis]
MGLSSFPGAAEGVLPVLVMSTVLSVALLKSTVRSVLQLVVGANWIPPDHYEEELPEEYPRENARESRISITQFKSLNQNDGGARNSAMECCVCLCGFEDEEEVSELSCKHFFHRGCLDKWFDNIHTTCPLCRSNL